MIVLMKCLQKGNKMSDNWLDEYKEGLFSGRIPMRNPKIKKPGDPEYYYYDPRGMDKNAPLKDWKLIGVPTADTPNPALAEMDNSAKDKQLPQQNPNIYYDEKNDVYCDRSTGFEDDCYDVDLYGEDIPESLVKKMHADEKYKHSMTKYVQPNEGCYSNHPKDGGGITKYGITTNVYPKEDIKNLSRQRANAILYRDFWNYNGMNKLPKEVAGPLFDHSVNVGSPRGIEHIHRPLGIEDGEVIGSETLKRLNSQPYDVFMEKYKDYLRQYYINLKKQKLDQKDFEAGWLNRVNSYEVDY